MNNEKVYKYSFAKVYDCLLEKAIKKGRTKEEVYEVTSWLTGYTFNQINEMCEKDVTYQEFFENAPLYNPNAHLIKGTICGVKIEEIEDPLMQKFRHLDKLVDELAKGKSIDKILRK